MTRSLTRLILPLTVVAATASSLAQSAPPASPKAQTAVAQTAPGPITTLKAAAQLVIVDVVVTDSKQGPVHNLKASDFTVMENNAPQQVTGFEEHVSTPLAQAAKYAPMRPLPAGIFTNFTPVPPDAAVNVLLLDALNTHMKDQAYVRDQLLDFLRKTPPGTRIAIFALNSRLVMLHGFTTDLAELRASIAKTSMTASGVLATSGAEDPVGNGGTLTVGGVMRGVAGADMGQVMASMATQVAVQSSDDTQLRLNTTLAAMNQLARYLSGIPGRKNLMWFSGSYPADFSTQSEGKYRETANLLARSRVAIYPIGADGLTVNLPPICGSCPRPNGGALGNYQTQVTQSQAVEHSSMDRLAAATGGQAYLNTNGLSEAVGKAIDNGSNYYTLSYTPTNALQDGQFHKIQVKLAQQGLTLAYRDGYYADAPDSRTKRVETLAAAAFTQTNKLSDAMMRGAPDASEILLKLQVVPASAAEEKKPVPGNIANPSAAAKSEFKAPFRRYSIDIAADARDIHITKTADGHFHFSTEVLTFVYDANGVPINIAVEKAEGNLSLSSYANMAHVGVPFHQEISVPASGEYYLRTSVHDLETDRYGSVEIPVASIAKLTPLAAANTPQAAPK